MRDIRRGKEFYAMVMILLSGTLLNDMVAYVSVRWKIFLAFATLFSISQFTNRRMELKMPAARALHFEACGIKMPKQHIQLHMLYHMHA